MKKILSIVGLTLALIAAANIASAEKVTIKGSTTVLPIAQLVAERFMAENRDIDISLQGGGSGVGVASIIDGTADIGNASRPIQDKEIEQAVSKKVMPKAHVIAMDAIAVIVHPSNPVAKLKKSQIKDIYTGKMSNWSSLGGSGTIVVIS
ncbi:MAG: substrate-binding domain-containing protein, partial [Candidatus Omnitrophica bacterium]|nr:substrate-binding domain-containing protein [Candidatus Omnitrophota bacterium]